MNIDKDIIDLPEIVLNKTPRPQQKKLLEFTKKSILSNNKFILIEGPVGSGKSYYSVMFMDWFKREFDISASFDILTNSKILQEQYTNDFNFMCSLWGKGSYYCETYNTSCETGLKLCKLNNTTCDNCPYKIAKYRFDNGTVGLANYHLFLTYKLLVPNAWKRTSRVLIIDEADSFESVFCDFLSTDINKYVLKSNGFNEYEVQECMNLFNIETPLNEFIDKLETVIECGYSVLQRLSVEFKDTRDIKIMEKGQALKRTIQKWETLIEEYNNDPDNWILDNNINETYTKNNKIKDEFLQLSLKPIWGKNYMTKIWNDYDYVIFMSGTILDKDIFSKMNGLDVNRTTYISLESTFDVKNRPIYYFKNIGKQTYNTKELTWKKQIPILNKIINKHKNEKGIIHTANYELQRWVNEKFTNTNRLLIHDTANRNEQLNAHYNTDEPTILVSPSMNVGVDLPDHFSRFQVILKMPYPNLGSKRIKQRMKSMSEYYGITTVRAIIQSYGRSIRNSTDYANTYIIDNSFDNILKWNRQYFPKWVLEAIQFVE